MTYKDLYKIWKKKRSGPGWSKQQGSEKEFKSWIYDKLMNLRGPQMWQVNKMRAKRRNLKQHISSRSTSFGSHTYRKTKVPAVFYRKRRR